MYSVDEMGRFTQQSLKTWRDRSQKCYDYLNKCEKFLGQIMEMGKKYPIYEGDAEWAKGVQSKVNSMRMTIKENATRKGI